MKTCFMMHRHEPSQTQQSPPASRTGPQEAALHRGLLGTVRSGLRSSDCIGVNDIGEAHGHMGPQPCAGHFHLLARGRLAHLYRAPGELIRAN